MSDLLPVAEAVARICHRCRPLAAETEPLNRAWGRVLAADVVSDTDLPPFDNSAMDGYAVRAADLAAARPERPLILPVAAVIEAGRSPGPLPHAAAMKIMTGAPLPDGADAVVPVERVDPAEEAVTFYAAPQAGANCRPRGADLRAGSTVLTAGTSLGHAELALLAAVGRVTVAVARRPRVAVITTGDELVDPADQPGPGQIRDSSRYAIPAQLAAAGAEVVSVTCVADVEGNLRRCFAGLSGVDLVVTTGGVSMGDRDLVRPLLAELGEIDFWRVAVKPGKPLLFGSLDGAPFFGLPGNPVSSMVCLDLFVRPAVDRLLGRCDGGRLRLKGRLAAEVRSEAAREEYVRVRARGDDDGVLWAEPTGDQSSGILTSMRGANAYVVLPVGVDGGKTGEAVDVELFDAGPGAAR